jgi:hypothetical protein
MEQLQPEYSEWYVGITNDVSRRLAEHGLPEDGKFKSYNAQSLQTARAAEEHIALWGVQGGERLGNTEKDTTFVYVYKIISGKTKEQT